MFKDWGSEEFSFVGFLAVLLTIILSVGTIFIVQYDENIQMAKLGYVQVVQQVATNQGTTYVKVWVPRENVEKK